MSNRYVVVEEDGYVVAVDTLITPELSNEGTVNEICHQVNTLRKKLGCNITEQVELYFDSDDDDVISAICSAESHILSETQASKLYIVPPDRDIEYRKVTIQVYRANVLPPQSYLAELSIGIKKRK